jgi:hypothetical protein
MKKIGTSTNTNHGPFEGYSTILAFVLKKKPNKFCVECNEDDYISHNIA